MSTLSEALQALEAMAGLGPKVPAGGLEVLGQSLSYAQLVQGVKALEGLPWSTIAKVLEEHFSNLSNDLVVAGDVAAVLAVVDPPVGLEVELAVKVAAMVVGLLGGANLRLQISLAPGQPSWAGVRKGGGIGE